MIATGYKVVNKDSNNTSLYTNGKYQLCYPTGQIVTALPGTLGIMIFDTLEHMQAMMPLALESQVVTVLLISYDYSKAVKPSVVCASMSTYLLDVFYARRSTGIQLGLLGDEPLLGTLCCTSVKVLKEVTLP